MNIETPELEETSKTTEPVEPAPPVSNRFLFVDIAALRAKQRGAPARASTRRTHDSHPQPKKAERVAMEEVEAAAGAVRPAGGQKPIHNPETGI